MMHRILSALGWPYRHRALVCGFFAAILWLNALTGDRMMIVILPPLCLSWLLILLADLAAAGNNAPPERFEPTLTQKRVLGLALASCFACLLFEWLVHEGSTSAMFVLLCTMAAPFYLPPRKQPV